jgi:hypothetical protein
MNNRIPSLKLMLLLISLGFGLTASSQQWRLLQAKEYSVYYPENLTDKIPEYNQIFDKGTQIVKDFFGSSFQKPFEIRIYSSRHTLDSAWSSEWGMPGFTSECWMVASGTADKLDILSPAVWNTEACEHVYSDSLATLRLFTHEMVHVFHGQLNASPDFSDITGLDWFVEGLATFASGQCEAKRMEEVKALIQKGMAPADLASFWTGKNKYGLSGSMLMYLDAHFGRDRLISLLPFNRLEHLLGALKVSEGALVEGWKSYMLTR